MSYALETISPELALVSPDLARRAREELLDRPWEAFLPARTAPALRLAPVAAATAQQAPAAAPVTAAAPRRRFRPPLGLTLLVGFAGLVIAGSVLPSRDAPTLGPPSAPAATTPLPRVTRPAAAATPVAPRTPLRRGLASIRSPRRIPL